MDFETIPEYRCAAEGLSVCATEEKISLLRPWVQ
jgi:hypothetical protein